MQTDSGGVVPVNCGLRSLSNSNVRNLDLQQKEDDTDTTDDISSPSKTSNYCAFPEDFPVPGNINKLGAQTSTTSTSMSSSSTTKQNVKTQLKVNKTQLSPIPSVDGNEGENGDDSPIHFNYE